MKQSRLALVLLGAMIVPFGLIKNDIIYYLLVLGLNHLDQFWLELKNVLMEIF